MSEALRGLVPLALDGRLVGLLDKEARRCFNETHKVGHVATTPTPKETIDEA